MVCHLFYLIQESDNKIKNPSVSEKIFILRHILSNKERNLIKLQFPLKWNFELT